jgi:peptidoglycan/xylan/chitin deacetylase (PgdA/CDA1 family)
MKAWWRTWPAVVGLAGAALLAVWLPPAASATRPALGDGGSSGPQPAFYTYQAPGGQGTLGKKVIALTFDDGPGPYTPQVESILAQYGVPATFFEIGDEVARYPQYARMVAAAGYPVENHTWSHPDLATLSISDLSFQIDQTQSEITAVTGETPTCLRPPYDDWNATVLQQVAQRGLVTMSYSIDPRDWSLPGVQAIVDRVVGGAFPGGVVDMHDGGGPRDQTVAALPQIITDLEAMGYTFVSICGSPTSVTRPSAIHRTALSMDVFYRTAGGGLAEDYWGPSRGWQVQVLPGSGLA